MGGMALALAAFALEGFGDFGEVFLFPFMSSVPNYYFRKEKLYNYIPYEFYFERRFGVRSGEIQPSEGFWVFKVLFSDKRFQRNLQPLGVVNKLGGCMNYCPATVAKLW